VPSAARQPWPARSAWVNGLSPIQGCRAVSSTLPAAQNTSVPRAAAKQSWAPGANGCGRASAEKEIVIVRSVDCVGLSG
jgi:hypothetical protein